MKGIIYTRVSSDEQIKGTSLDFQEEICRNYCKDRGIEVLAVFREEGASAKSADRKEFLKHSSLPRWTGLREIPKTISTFAKPYLITA